MNFNYYFNKMLDFYNVSTIKELSKITNIGASTISNWKQRQSITALKKKCRELGIYNEIFVINDFTSSYGYNYDYDSESSPSIYDEAQKKLEKQRTTRRTIDEILKMDETIVTSFMQVYKKLEEENNLIKLYEALGKLKYDS
ncbi:helix-turn-helix domain containing protein [Aliarcobacter butzleri]|uniref:helix-turn-helix domain containing protein n=1 Tax=Aliarcobacter butzleri TaxID=28197 RepID=UPI0021B3D728|nr:helix-turn-helix domain containing protein [Aliarcobacter butzleri]MCT7547306.1 helix-turn-helix domain containing protein [Aliarcobacter butzleri]